MNDVLQQELTGRPPDLVCLGGKDYPLDFSIHAVILYKKLTGDNLFDGQCWSKIAPLEDPERFIACLWAGLHSYEDDKWHVPFSRGQLEKLVDFTNVTPITESVALALAAYFPKAKKDEDSAGESQLPTAATASSEASPSPSSGPSPVLTSV